MADTTYAAIRNKQAELIRKAPQGSVFVADGNAATITTLTAGTGALLQTLPATYEDLGWTTNDGVSFARDVSQSEVSSWGSTTPTRTDILSDTSTMTVACQETKARTIALATGADWAALKASANATTGEVRLDKPLTPSSKNYRVLAVAVDETADGPIFIARFLPRGKVTSFAEQSFQGGDQTINWGVTFTGEPDSALGSSESWIFAGAGWKALLVKMGFGS